jgi:hypothetical protein
MTEEELIYDALMRPLGLVVRGSRARFANVKRKLLANDPALHELAIVGPDSAGQIYLLRTDAARAQTKGAG